MAEGTPATHRAHTGLIHVAIVTWGVLSLLAVALAFPLGAGLTVVNAVLACVARGTKRKLFAAFAIAGVVLCAVIYLTLFTIRF